tara:strand:- start:22531 stop:23076 length:546 start_codon:yes stop_codon:yes gene_type:complete
MIYFTLLAVFLQQLSSFTGYLVATPEGWRNSYDEKPYIVFSNPDLTSQGLYEKANRFIAYNYKHGEDVIKANVSNEMIRFNSGHEFMVPNGFISLKCRVIFEIELLFKDGKIKFTVLDQKAWMEDNPFDPFYKGWATWGIFYKSGKVKHEKFKYLFEQELKSVVDELNKFVLELEVEKEDW